MRKRTSEPLHWRREGILLDCEDRQGVAGVFLLTRFSRSLCDRFSASQAPQEVA